MRERRADRHDRPPDAEAAGCGEHLPRVRTSQGICPGDHRPPRAGAAGAGRGRGHEHPRVTDAEEVSIAVPRGDTEALAAAQEPLEEQRTLAAGASVIVDGRRAESSTGTVGVDRDADPGTDADAGEPTHS
jgi:hypothetical protein